MVEQEVISIIRKYGKDVLQYPLFLQSFSQTHHIVCTVGDHTLGVAVVAVRHCLRHRMTNETFLSEVVTACLCHDLGIIGRDEKFENNWQCLNAHPKDSLQIYQGLFEQSDAVVADAISHHMFPLFIGPPSSRVGWILIMADKISASRERLGHPTVTPEDRAKIMSSFL